MVVPCVQTSVCVRQVGKLTEQNSGVFNGTSGRNILHPILYIVVCLLKARTVEQYKQLLQGNGCVTFNNGVTVGSGVQ